jgi:hypothetical protein
MKKYYFFFLLYGCVNNKSNTLIENKIRRIDSQAIYMDTAILKSQDRVREVGIIEHYESYEAAFNRKFPEYGRYTVHNHDSLFTDSVFYFFRDSLIKFVAKKTKNQQVFDSSTLYFHNNEIIGDTDRIDSLSISSVLKTANYHLKQLHGQKISRKP